jgi:hypothetical protein
MEEMSDSLSPQAQAIRLGRERIMEMTKEEAHEVWSTEFLSFFLSFFAVSSNIKWDVFMSQVLYEIEGDLGVVESLFQSRMETITLRCLFNWIFTILHAFHGTGLETLESSPSFGHIFELMQGVTCDKDLPKDWDVVFLSEVKRYARKSAYPELAEEYFSAVSPAARALFLWADAMYSYLLMMHENLHEDNGT